MTHAWQNVEQSVIGTGLSPFVKAFCLGNACEVILCEQVEGVGLGAVASAGKHGTYDLDNLATWKAGQPVPFAFLAETFEAIAETTKRLVITSLLVCFASPAVMRQTSILQPPPCHAAALLSMCCAT